MNATNRAANRLLLVIVGLVLVAAGAAAIALGSLPAFATGWKGWFGDAERGAPSWATTPIAGTVGWFAVFVGVVALVIAVLLIALIVRQGRGHASAVLDRRFSPTGRARIDLAIPRTLLGEQLDADPDVLANRITAYSVHGMPTLKVSVRARRGASPRAVADGVLDALRALDAVLGEEVPAYVQVSGGFRARSSARARVA